MASCDATSKLCLWRQRLDAKAWVEGGDSFDLKFDLNLHLQVVDRGWGRGEAQIWTSCFCQ